MEHLEYPIINYRQQIKKELIESLKKIDKMTIFFNKKGGLLRKEELVRWKLNRHIQDSLYYIYLFRKYRNSCPIPVKSFNRNIPIFNKPLTYDLKLNLITVNNIPNENALHDYNQYLIDNCRLVINCLQDKDLVILPVVLNFTLNNPFRSAHANLLIFRKIKKTIEVFEPHGNSFKGKQNRNININLAYHNFIDLFNQELELIEQEPYNLITSDNVCPFNLGLQGIENIYANKIREIEGNGYCSLWSLYVCEMILMNPNLTTSLIMKKLLQSHSRYIFSSIAIFDA